MMHLASGSGDIEEVAEREGGGGGDGKGDMLGREKGTNTECSAKPYIRLKDNS